MHLYDRSIEIINGGEITYDNETKTEEQEIQWAKDPITGLWIC